MNSQTWLKKFRMSLVFCVFFHPDYILVITNISTVNMIISKNREYSYK